MLSPVRAGALNQPAQFSNHAPSVRESPGAEWAYTKPVFGTVLGAGYLVAILALIYPFYMYMH
jgi:hypothetical protein